MEWLRKIKRGAIARTIYGDEPPEFDDSQEHVKGPPLYQSGPFAVIDTVEDLEYVVIDTRTMQQARGPISLDFDEAKRVADDMARAAELGAYDDARRRMGT